MLTRSFTYSPPVLISALLLLTLTACGGCGENNNTTGDTTATVSIDNNVKAVRADTAIVCARGKLQFLTQG